MESLDPQNIMEEDSKEDQEEEDLLGSKESQTDYKRQVENPTCHYGGSQNEYNVYQHLQNKFLH